MRNKLVYAGILLVLIILPLVSSEELWSFSKFRNVYSVYGSYTCKVLGNSYCPSEMGWQGNQLIFQFYMNKPNNLPGILTFNLESIYFINQKPVDIYVNEFRVAKDFIVTRGVYSINFTRAAVSPGKNTISVIMKNAPVGYGQPSAGFILGQVSLESIDGTVLKNCFKKIDCGTDGFIGQRFCYGLNVKQNYTTYTCTNPGVNGKCSSSVSAKYVKTCTAPKCGDFGRKYCKNDNVYHSRTCYVAGCSNGACNSTKILDEEKVSSCKYGCLKGACVKK